MLYSCSHGDATLFSRGDLVEAAWRVAQPMLDYLVRPPAPSSPTMRAAAGARRRRRTSSQRDGRRWHEVVTEEVLKRVPSSRTATCSSSRKSSWRFARSQAAAGPDDPAQRAMSGASCTSSPAARSRCSTTPAAHQGAQGRRFLRRDRPAAVDAADEPTSARGPTATCSCSTRPTSAASCASIRSSPKASPRSPASGTTSIFIRRRPVRK